MSFFFFYPGKNGNGLKWLSSTPADVFSLIGVSAELGIFGGMLIG